MSSATRNPIFIVSRPRTGSTLLRSVLSSHSQIQLVNEPDLIMGMRMLGYTIDESFDEAKRRELIDTLARHAGCRRHLQTLSQNQIAEFISDNSAHSFRAVYERLLPKPLGVSVWGDKCVGSSLFVIDDIFEMYPQALVIHITRDPRAVLLSTYQKRLAQSEDRLPPFRRETIAFFAYESMKWNAAIAALNASRCKLAASQFYELAFEDFVSDPEKELRSLLSVAGLPYEAEMLDPIHRRDDPVLQNDCAFAHQRLNQAIDSSRAQGGSRLPDWASFVIQRCARESLAQSGYQLSERPTLIQRSVINAGLLAFYPKILKRLQRETAWAANRKASSDARSSPTSQDRQLVTP